MFINTFKYSPRDVDCKLCTEYARKNACTAERCLWLSERIEADVVGYEEVLLESFPKKSPFRWRLRLLVDLFSGTLWNNEKHSRRMEAQKAINGYSRRRDTPEYYAALYLLTSDSDVYGRTAALPLLLGLAGSHRIVGQGFHEANIF